MVQNFVSQDHRDMKSMFEVINFGLMALMVLCFVVFFSLPFFVSASMDSGFCSPDYLKYEALLMFVIFVILTIPKGGLVESVKFKNAAQEHKNPQRPI